MKHSLTIVLRVHNRESQLRSNVHEMLELAGELTDHFHILIVDDASVDDTFEVANELAAEFPQVSVRRQSCRSGLGPALKAIRGHVSSDIVVVHDGVTPLDAGQLQKLWRQYEQSQDGKSATANPLTGGIGDLAQIAELQSALSRAHRRIMGLTIMSSLSMHDSTDHSQRAGTAAQHGTRTIHPSADRLGRIPTLPRPNFLKAITDFALGE